MTVLRPYNNFDYTSYSNPATDTNPPSVGMTWVNLTSGGIFVCIDNTIDNNIWATSASDINSDERDPIFQQRDHRQTFMDASYSDVKATNHNATIDGNIASFVRSSGQYITFTPWIKSSNTFSVNAWINLDSIASSGDGSTSRRGIFYEGTTNHKIGFSVYDDGCVLFGVYIGSYYEIFNTTTKLSISTDYMLTGVRNAGNIYLYVNGTQAGTTTCPTTDLSQFGQCYFGRQGSGQEFDGDITDLCLYDVALTQAEITDLYSAGI